MLRWSSTPEVRGQIDLALKANPDQWLELTIPFEHFEHARSRILGWGAAAEVLSPRALRDSIADFAQQTALLYSKTA
jgi:predicted DNA-binding transcriptional regulator YafY